MAILTTTHNGLNFTGGTTYIQTGTTTLMAIEVAGNVGIGTTTFPTTAIGERELLVQGAIVSKPPGVNDYYSYLKSNWANDGAFELGIQGANTNHKFITSSNYYHGTQLNFHTSDQKRMIIDTNGNVGIGVTGPSAKLHVESTTAAGASFILETTHTSGIPLLDLKGAHSAQLRYKDELNVIQGRIDFGDSGTFNFIDVPNNNSTLYLKTGGNVGIGTINPRDTLEIVGNMRFVDGEDHLMIKPNNAIHGADFIVGDGVATTDTPVMSLNGLYGGQVTIQTQGNSVADKTVLDVQGTQGQLFSVTDDLSGDIFSVADISGVPILNVNSSGLVTVDGTSYFNGNVGIGTNNPGYPLEVNGEIDVSGDGYYMNGYAWAYMGPSATVLTLGDWDGNDFPTRIMDQNSSEVLRVTDGNVGIGSTTPASKLNVASTGTNPYTATLDSASNMKGIRNVLTSNTDDMVGIYFATGTTTTGTHWSGITGSRSDNASHWGTQLNFYTHNNDVAQLNHATQKMVIKGDGNVGIGVTGPLVKLHVNQGNVSGTVIKASGIQAQIEIQTSTAGDAHLYMRPNTTGNKAAIFKMTAGTNYNWRWQDDATTPVVFMQLSQSNSSLSVKGDIIAYGAPSDKRYKENIRPIESALDKAVKLQGVTFDWKESDSILDIKEDIGFIAQDVQKVVPELVRENEDGKLSLRYQGVTPILLEAIKELKAEIDLLKSKPCNCNNCNCSI